MIRATQQSFGNISSEFKDYWKTSGRKVHGGIHANGKRKTARPFDTKKPLHLVLRSSRAKGSLSMSSPLNKRKVDQIVYEFAERSDVKIYDYSNNGNHLHLSVRAPTRIAFQKFIRTITGLIARIVMKAKKGEPKGKFWDALAFSRVADWGKAFGNLRKYIYQNVLEGAGIIPYDRKKYRFVKIDSSA